MTLNRITLPLALLALTLGLVALLADIDVLGVPAMALAVLVLVSNARRR